MPYKNEADQAEASRRYYARNRAAMIERAVDWRRQRRAELRAIAQGAKDRPCADCGVRYPFYVMQFDHVGDKYAEVAELVARAVAVERLVAEIAKCEVVCANCHAERTFRRRELDESVGRHPAGKRRDLTEPPRQEILRLVVDQR